MTTVAVLVPRRAGDPYRDGVWAWVQQRWTDFLPSWRVYEGHHDTGPFNRSAAINAAACSAGDWDVAVIADADSVASVDQLAGAARIALDTDQMTLAYDRYVYLSRNGTKQVMRGYAGDWQPLREWEMTGTCSSMVVVSRRLWDQVGGFDAGFVGWGFEDVAFSVACQSLTHGLHRVTGPVFHLWHPPSTENDTESPQWQANLARLERYRAVQNNEPGMRALLEEISVELVA